jgi:radical SAM protein with 4Fe4S-binding SPASM domain
VSLNSHGVYSQDACQRLADLSIEQIIISLDGLQDANDQIRGNGVFQHIRKTIISLRAAGQSVTIGVHLGRYNKNDIPGLVAVAADLGCDIKFSPLRPLGRAKQYLLQDVLQPFEFYLAVREITRLRTIYPGIRILTDYDILRPFETIEPQPLERANCPAGRSFLNIGCDGFLYPCAFLITPEHEFAAGHIHETSLLAAWRGSPVFQVFREMNKDEKCQTCPVYTRTCVGGCVAISYLNTGDLSAHDPTCFIAHVSRDDFFQREHHDDPL